MPPSTLAFKLDQFVAHLVSGSSKHFSGRFSAKISEGARTYQV